MSNLTPAGNLAQAIRQVGQEIALRTHQLAAAGDEAGLTAVEAEVDEASAELWGITDRELREIRRSLEELG